MDLNAIHITISVAALLGILGAFVRLGQTIEVIKSHGVKIDRHEPKINEHDTRLSVLESHAGECKAG